MQETKVYESTAHLNAPSVAADAPLAERLAFIRKVYSLLALSLLFGVAAGVVTISNPGFLEFVARNFFLFIIAEFGVLIAANFVRQNGGLAMLMLNAFTVLTGITTAPMVYVYSDVAFPAALTTLAVFSGLTVYTFVSRRDFSFLSGILIVGLIAMIVLSLLNAFWMKSSATQMLLAAAGVFIFSGFILYETSNIIRRYPTNMYIQATLGLYISILNLFLSLLQLFGGSRR